MIYSKCLLDRAYLDFKAIGTIRKLGEIMPATAGSEGASLNVTDLYLNLRRAKDESPYFVFMYPSNGPFKNPPSDAAYLPFEINDEATAKQIFDSINSPEDFEAECRRALDALGGE